MSDTESPDKADQSSTNPSRRVIAEGMPDLVLATLIAFIETHEENLLAITLNLDGQVITGNLVPRSVWFAALLDQVASSDTGRAMIEGVRDGLEEYGDEDGALRTFVHLRDARVVSGGTVIGEGGHWRCKTGDISGWCLGTMVAS